MPRFVVHEHHARNLHWDLRLELDGVLKSWAVPKEPPLALGVRRLAIQVDDHDLDYIGFEGTIGDGSYGAGSVRIWDAGMFSLVDRKPYKLIFDCQGQKLTGPYVLMKFERAGKKEWLLFKKRPAGK